MAEPIRRITPPLHRRPQGVRPHPRPRPVALVRDETGPEPPPQPAPEPERPRAFQPVPEKRLRTFLQAALGLHLAAALLLPFLASSAGPSAGLSDTLLAAAVLLAGSAVLVLGAFGKRAG